MHVLLNLVKLRRKIIQNTGRKYSKIAKKEKGKKASLFKSKGHKERATLISMPWLVSLILSNSLDSYLSGFSCSKMIHLLGSSWC